MDAVLKFVSGAQFERARGTGVGAAPQYTDPSILGRPGEFRCERRRIPACADSAELQTRGQKGGKKKFPVSPLFRFAELHV
jgi:hypothetical protein